jgi:hypothetical protein
LSSQSHAPSIHASSPGAICATTYGSDQPFEFVVAEIGEGGENGNTISVHRVSGRLD